MRVVVTGTRGIPAIQGGVETHCKELFPRLVKMGVDVSVVRRSCYIPPEDKLKEYKGVKLKTIYAPHNKYMEAIIHTFLAVLWAKGNKAEIIHIHAIGPGIMVPFARLLGLKVVFTHHGPDYDRKKWGRVARFFLRTGEKFAASCANEVIVISDVIRNLLVEKYSRNDTNLIFNGVSDPVISLNTDFIAGLELESRKYVFTLGRFVEEKGFDFLIRSFSNVKYKDYKLVIAGDSDHETEYSIRLKDLARDNNVVLTGFVKGEKLYQLFSHASLFVLPSFHEGLPISLLEAMSYRLPVLVSDIAANRQIALSEDRFFITGNESSLNERLSHHLSLGYKPVKYDMTEYNWDRIALQTKHVYERIIQLLSVS
jgi:glycosyltransferase involved in cell wall biosynthesis